MRTVTAFRDEERLEKAGNGELLVAVKALIYTFLSNTNFQGISVTRHSSRELCQVCCLLKLSETPGFLFKLGSSPAIIMHANIAPATTNPIRLIAGSTAMARQQRFISFKHRDKSMIRRLSQM